MKPPIYEPAGRAKEYGDLALNIYTGCPHECFYCFAPKVVFKKREEFHANVQPRPGIVEEVRKQLDKEHITGKLIHLCFTCDPYPMGIDTTETREIIKLLKAAGNHVQILTKGGRAAERDFDLLDENDRFGITYAGYNENWKSIAKEEPNAASPNDRIISLMNARKRGIKTWVSFEPVLNTEDVLVQLQNIPTNVDVKIGKLNYHKSDNNWGTFGRRAEQICKWRGLKYYIKDSLRAEMELNA
jgi:DNA repair photolyase